MVPKATGMLLRTCILSFPSSNEYEATIAVAHCIIRAPQNCSKQEGAVQHATNLRRTGLQHG